MLFIFSNNCFTFDRQNVFIMALVTVFLSSLYLLVSIFSCHFRGRSILLYLSHKISIPWLYYYMRYLLSPAWEQHEANPAFWLVNQVAIKGLLFFDSVFMDLNFVPGQKCKKEYDQYPAIMTSHHIYLLKERKRHVVYFFLTMFHLRCSICHCHHRKIPFFQ